MKPMFLPEVEAFEGTGAARRRDQGDEGGGRAGT
jgi:hypothetical protein